MDIKECLLDIYSDGGEWEDFEPHIDDILSRIAALEARLKEAVVMLDEAHKHLEFCGYGDACERDCARDDKLDQRITAILEANSKLLEAQA